VLLLTTLDAWRARPDEPFRSETAAYAPEEDAAALATDAFGGDQQVIALVFDHPPLTLPGAVNRATVTEIRYARRDPSGRVTGLHTRPTIAEALDLMPHPEGGWFRETWRTSVRVAAHGGERATATGIYFLLGPGDESMWHAVRSDEVWLWHRGGPLELTVRDGAGAGESTVVLGPDVEDGQVPQAVVPGGVWQSARPATDREVLVSCVVSPGFDPADFSV
jgi:predicted cupin superfamily sugar epimerase